MSFISMLRFYIWPRTPHLSLLMQGFVFSDFLLRWLGKWADVFMMHRCFSSMCGHCDIYINLNFSDPCCCFASLLVGGFAAVLASSCCFFFSLQLRATQASCLNAELPTFSTPTNKAGWLILNLLCFLCFVSIIMCLSGLTQAKHP